MLEKKIDSLIDTAKKKDVWKPVKHVRLLKWKKSYHRCGVTHHYQGRDLRNDKKF